MKLELGPVLRTFRRKPGVLVMVVAEVAFGAATICALLLAGSWYGGRGVVPSGLDEQSLILVSTDSPEASEEAVLARQADDARRVRAVAGVAALTRVSTTIVDDRWIYPTMFQARAAAGPARDGIGWPVFTDTEAPRALGLRLLAGSVPLATDDAATTGAVLTRCLAERLFGDPARAVGGTFISEQNAAARVQGVVENVTMRMPFMPQADCVAFLFSGAPVGNEGRLLVRTRPGTRDAVVARLRAALAGDGARFVDVAALDSHHGVHNRIGLGMVRLLMIFSIMAGLVTLLGALAATSFLVAERTRQTGIRRALGATRSDVVGYFLVESALATTLGTALGLAGTALLFMMMRHVFASISVSLPLVGGGLVLLWVGSLAATLIPALRAARVPPSVASRSL